MNLFQIQESGTINLMLCWFVIGCNIKALQGKQSIISDVCHAMQKRGKITPSQSLYCLNAEMKLVACVIKTVMMVSAKQSLSNT